MEIVITPESVASIAGALLSLLFAYVPGLNTRYTALSGEQKRLVMAGVLALVAVGIYALSCAGVMQGVTCTGEGVFALVQIFIAALVANQGVYLLATPRPAR